ncbi:MAG: hypothetical protein QM680_07360 [Luteolibacter sp.]
METKTTTATATYAATSKSNVGSAILALSGMISATYNKKPSGKAISCRIKLEKEGVLRPVADRIASGLALSEKSYRLFKAISKGKSEFAEGAGKVIKLAKELAERGIAISEYKSAQSTTEAAPEVAAAA